MTTRIPARAIEGLVTPGSEAVAAGAVTVTPTGSIAANDVQAALEELDAEKAPVGHTHTTGSTVLVPLTTTVDGVPQDVWDENDNKVMTEVPT